jgi:hypothetical protein
MHQEEGFKFCLDTRSKKALPWLVYSSTVVASDAQLGWFMRFCNGMFIPISLGYGYKLGVIVRSQIPSAIGDESMKIP